ncbi:Mu transposase C-terminal domain-containing protein [Desulfosporosinus meridiei]|uniref:Transposase-like Mu C-terminal domain-containing protein n=1 Tax=Desulfosporosinus meridiei (strain ATCC BAA-275 / DSM 13257 / KCTC 12902 / NCIMB 13706 / S10) TaxID=768704 RepID=J7ILL0_DESMD|nr:hypothetical protein Desmer_0385 [Desulfosporosinus meridiei DSM 13257]
MIHNIKLEKAHAVLSHQILYFKNIIYYPYEVDVFEEQLTTTVEVWYDPYDFSYIYIFDSNNSKYIKYMHLG